MFRILAALVCLFSASVLVAAPVLELSEGLLKTRGKIELVPHIEYLLDPGGNLDFGSIRQQPQDWKAAPKKGLSFGYRKDALWIRFQIRNPLKTKKRLYLELVSLIDHIDLYRPNPNGGYTKSYFSRWRPMAEREHKHRNFLFDLELPASKTLTYYMRFASTGSLLVPLSLWEPEAFFRRDHEEQLVFGIYFGIILVMALYNLFIYFTVRSASYLYYVGYILSTGITLGGVWGFGHEYLFDWNLWIANYALPIFSNLSAFFTLLFSYHFLPGFKRSRGWRNALFIICGLLVMQLLVGLQADYAWTIRTALLLVFLTVLFVMTAATTNLIWGYREARYFLLAFVTLLCGVVAIILRNVGILPYNFFVNYSIQIGSALEVVLLSFALGDRFNIMRKEKERVQKEALEQERKMSESFVRFVPRQFLVLLGRKRFTDVELGDATRLRMSVLFSDIRSFTTLSENMTPSDNFAFINGYLRRMGPHIRKNSGFIDKYIGDAIMALFPEGESHALAASLGMLEELRRYNEERISYGKDALRIGIGLHSGDLMLGTIGDRDRMEGTVIGDAVNLAARMEGLTRNFGADLIVSEEIYKEIPVIEFEDRCAFRFLGKVQVKGKRSLIGIYQVFLRGVPEYEALIADIPLFSSAVACLLNEQFEEARARFVELKHKHPEDKAISYLLDSLPISQKLEGNV